MQLAADAAILEATDGQFDIFAQVSQCFQNKIEQQLSRVHEQSWLSSTFMAAALAFFSKEDVTNCAVVPSYILGLQITKDELISSSS